MYVRTGVEYAGARPAALGTGFGDVPAADPGQLLTDTISQARDRGGLALLFGLVILAGAGWMVAHSGRR